MIAESFPDVLRSTSVPANEVGIYCWDHVKWHDDPPWFPKHLTAMELGRASALFEEILGHRARPPRLRRDGQYRRIRWRCRMPWGFPIPVTAVVPPRFIRSWPAGASAPCRSPPPCRPPTRSWERAALPPQISMTFTVTTCKRA